MATKNYKGAKFNPGKYDNALDSNSDNHYSKTIAKNWDQAQDNLGRYQEEFDYRYGLSSKAPRARKDTREDLFQSTFDNTKYGIPTTSLDLKANIPDVPTKSGLEAYKEKMNKARGDKLPSFLKPLYDKVLDPVAYGIDKTLYGNPLSQRTMVKAGETLAGKGSMQDYDGTKLEAKDAGKIGNFLADSAGTLAGMAVTPTGGGNSLLNATDDIGLKAGEFVSKKLPSKLNPTLSKVIPSMARGAVDNGLGDMALSVAQGEDLGTTLKTGGASALGGALLFGAGKGIGEGLSNVKGMKKMPELPKVTGEIATKPKITNVRSLSPLNPEPKLENIMPKMKEANMSATPSKKPSLPQFEKINSEVATTGNATGPQQKVSEFKTNTMRNSPMLDTKETQRVIDDIHATYNVKPNEQSLKRAMADLETNPSEVVDRIRKSEQLTGAEDTVAAGVITKQLRETAEKSGDYTELKSWLEELQPKVTETAQSLQALSTWKKLTPEGALMKAQQVVGKVNREGEKAFGKKWSKVELTNDDIKFINDKMKELDVMADGRAKDIEFAKVKQLIAEKVPPNFAGKSKALQRISLLLNTKTMTRNILGNVVMGGLENIKDIPGSLIDRAVSGKFGGERTTLMPSFPGIKTQLKGGLRGAKETLEDYKLGINTSPSAGQYDLPDTRAFRKGPLSKLEGVTNLGLTLGDRPFWQGAYDDTLRQQMKIKGVMEPTEEMIEMAKKVADERTFQNTSKLVESFKKLQSGLNFNHSIGLGNVVMPFTKTPANILDKAVDYSPLGGVRGLYNLFSGKGSQKQVVDQLSRSLTGSSLIAAGYLLAKDGKLQGQANKDYDVASLEKQTGKMPYSVKVGDKYETIDWAQPAAIPLMIGADMFHEGKNQKDVDKTIIEAVMSGATTLFNQSLLQGMSKLFGGYSQSGGRNLTEGIGKSVLQIPGQFVPSALKQGAQLLDNKTRDTSSPSFIGSEINKIKTKIPMLSTTLPKKINTLGSEVEQFNGSKGLKYGFDVLFNPGYSNTYNPTDVEKYVLDLYEKSGETIHFPRVAKGYIDYATGKGKKDRINLTSEEKMELQKYIGEKTAGTFKNKIPSLKSKSPQDQAKELQKVLTEIYNNGEEYILRKRGIKEYKGK